jgi:hypothetical protein
MDLIENAVSIHCYVFMHYHGNALQMSAFFGCYRNSNNKPLHRNRSVLSIAMWEGTFKLSYHPHVLCKAVSECLRIETVDRNSHWLVGQARYTFKIIYLSSL